MSAKIRIEIDLGLCTGHGRCYDLAPNVFSDDERGYGQPITPVLRLEYLKEAQSAAGACPERAILLKSIAEDDA